MKRLFYLSLLLLFFVYPTDLNASSFLTVTPNGGITVNVLGVETVNEPAQDTISSFEVTDIADYSLEPDAKIALSKSGDRMKLAVSTSLGEKDVDVTNLTDDLVEIEQRPASQKLTISHKDNKFTIKQNEISATTDYEISIDPQSAKLSLKTPTGFKFLTILPRSAVDLVLRADYLDEVKEDGLDITENSDGELAYTIMGAKILNIFNIYSHRVDVSTHVSVSSGKVLAVDEPMWLKFVGFLFV